MEKPVCRLCGSRHWTVESHVFPDGVKPKKVKRVVVSKREDDSKDQLIVELRARLKVAEAGIECPVCEDRKRKNRDRVRKHREKNG